MIKQSKVFLSPLLMVLGAFLLLGPRSAVLAQQSSNNIVLLNNHQQLLPLNSLDERSIALVSQRDALQPLHERLERYAGLTAFRFPGNADGFHRLDESLKLFNTIIFTLTAGDTRNASVLNFINHQAIGKDVIVVLIGEGRFLQVFDQAQFPIVWTPDNDTEALQNAGMSVFGGIACHGVLPQTFSLRYTKGSGFATAQSRLMYAPQRTTGFDHALFADSVDAIMAHGIREEAFPGGVVMVVKDGNVIFEKAYGHHTYAKQRPTVLGDIFDLASITKIAATTPVIMKLTEEKLINLDSTMGHYLWQAAASNKAGTVLRDVMLHEAGFIPFIPFYRDLKPDDMSRDSSAAYSVKVADNAYIRTGYYEEVMWPIMLNSQLNPTGKYVYSDISMYVMKEVAEHQTGIPIQQMVQDYFYKPLGMRTAGFNPRERFEKSRIIPTEDDQVFRKTLLEGYVHDQGAAMAGGIAGHAGLFSSANDLAIYGQMLLNRGEYGGERYLKGSTVDQFTAKQSENSRRGLGFDRKDPNPGQSYPSAWTSDFTFGHTGYTGTSMWVDPEQRLIYIFLSNRVHPQVSNKLSSLAIRMRIFDSIYQALGQKDEKNVR